jgi:DNA-binding LytR/AlgR family response regulator
LRETMNSIAARLPEDRFVRISRTSIVNLARVKELHPLFHGEYSIVLQDGVKLTLSRSHREQLARLGVRPLSAETPRVRNQTAAHAGQPTNGGE